MSFLTNISRPECFGEIPETAIVKLRFSKVADLFSIDKKRQLITLLILAAMGRYFKIVP